jgi:phage-related tail fiber protein
MTSTAADQINGFSGSLALKQPVRLATLVDIVLEGLIAIDGIVPAEGDRVLVKAQATPSQNGIYIASTGVWSRAADFDATGKAVKGTQVWVTDGTTQAGTLWIVSAANPIVDTSALTWQAGNAYQRARRWRRPSSPPHRSRRPWQPTASATSTAWTILSSR